MKTRTRRLPATDLIGWTVTTAMAAALSYKLTTYDVPFPAILCVALAILLAGMSFTQDITENVTTERYQCPEDGCGAILRTPRRPADHRIIHLHTPADSTHGDNTQAGTR